MQDTEKKPPADAGRLQRDVGRLQPERCRDCGLTLAPWLRLWCTKCVQKHLGDDR